MVEIAGTPPATDDEKVMYDTANFGVLARKWLLAIHSHFCIQNAASNPVGSRDGERGKGPLLISSLDKPHSEKLKGNGTTLFRLVFIVVKEASYQMGKNTIDFVLQELKFVPKSHLKQSRLP